ncbi:MAG TPA: penicillin-binding transpeptidase domain-containing protein [Terriglobales bacterium]|nr:penicillin-binding transpeptidase domain-containing protein [Terriglobales bacterium]
MNKQIGIIRNSFIALLIFAVSLLAPQETQAGTTPTTKKTHKSPVVTESTKTSKKMSKLKASRPRAKTYSKKRKSSRKRYYEKFYTSSYADGVTANDMTAGEDPVVRAAAIEALGNMNGTVVAVDPDTGRILAMVNQELALSEGAQPCSTFKTAVGLAALSEGIITRETNIKLGRRSSMNLTRALAVSNNAYFEILGRRLGFEKVSHYAQQFGLGELAGYNIEGEHLGTFPTEELDGRLGGVGKMCSFGESISLTPLQLAAMTSAIANGGNLYYLQHPRSQDEVQNFQPRLKRTLDIANHIPDVAEGMGGAVQYGTARSVSYNFNEEQVRGKTGTCSKDGTRFGWFASYANTQHGRIVTVVFLRGGRPTYGPKAAEITGRIYRNLYDHSFFAAKGTPERNTALGATQ